MSGKRPVSHRRVHCYLMIVIVLFAGTLCGMWRALGHRTTAAATIMQSTITTDLVNSISRTSKDETLTITSDSIADGTIQGRDIAPAAVGMKDLSPDVVDRLQSSQAVASSALLTPEFTDALRQLLGLPEGLLNSLGLNGLISTDQIADGAVGLLQLADDAVTSLNIVDGSIGLDDLDSTVIGALNAVGTLANDSVTSLQITDGSIDLADLDGTLTTLLGGIGTVPDNSITSLKLVDGAVDTVDLAVGSVNGSVVANSAIGVLQLADDAVTSVKIADGAVGTDDLQLGAITGGLIANQTIQLGNLDDSIVNALSLVGTIADSSVTSLKIADGAITADDIAGGAIGTLQLADNAVTSLNITDGAVGVDDLSSAVADLLSLAGTIPDNSITSLKIVNGAVAAGDLSTSLNNALALIGTVPDGYISAAKIADGAVGAGQVADGAITLLKLDSTISDLLGVLDNLVSGGNIAVTGDMIGAGTIASSNLDSLINGKLDLAGTVPDGYVTSLKILDGTIASGDIADSAISTLQLAGDAVTAAKIADGTIALEDLSQGLQDTWNTLSSLISGGNIAISGGMITDGTITAGDIAGGAIGSLQLGSGAVTADKLSSAAGTRTAATLVGTITVTLLAGSDDFPVFVAPSAGTITKITLTNKLGLSLSATASIQKNGSGTVASTQLNVLSAMTPYTMTLSGDTGMATGDLFSLHISATVAVTLTNFLVTIQYIPSG